MSQQKKSKEEEEEMLSWISNCNPHTLVGGGLREPLVEFAGRKEGDKDWLLDTCFLTRGFNEE